MSTDEKNIPIPDAPDAAGDASGGEDIHAFLDSASGGEANEFLDKLYEESFADLTSDFDSLLQEFRSIDPDELGVPQNGQPPQPEKQPEKAEMEDIFSYSDHETDHPAPTRKFSDAVQEAMEAELAQEQSAPDGEDDTFRIALDRVDGESRGFSEAVEAATIDEPQENGSTRIFGAVSEPTQTDKPVRPAAQTPRGSAEKRPPQTKTPKKKRFRLLPQKNDSTFEIFRKVLFLVSVVVVIVCLAIIGNIYLLQPTLEKRRQAKIGDLKGEGVSDAASFEQAFGNTDLPTGARYNLAQFYAANNDFYGYLEIPGTGISTPVVQGKDNSKYLHRNFFGESTKYGCPFVNYKNTYAALDYNTSIFGHNMEYDDLVFGELEKYRKVDGFKAAPLIHLETMYADHYFKIYAVFLTDADWDTSGWFFNYIFTQLKDEAECKEYIAQLDQRKLYSTGVDIKPTDQLLTLSTCTYDFEGERLVVVGRLVREGESHDVDVSKAVANNNPRYPDRYYKKRGLTNPYLNAEKWIPNA